MFGEAGAWTVAEKMEVYIKAFEFMREGENDLEARDYSEARMKFAEAQALFGELEEYSQTTKAQDLIHVCSRNLERERARTDLYLIVAVVIITAGFTTLRWKKERA